MRFYGGKAKNDRIDPHKIAVLLRGGMLPQAYVYPAAMRSTQELASPVAPTSVGTTGRTRSALLTRGELIGVRPRTRFSR